MPSMAVFHCALRAAVSAADVMAESAGAEALMYGAVAQQANAAANMRGRYSGRNISIS